MSIRSLSRPLFSLLLVISVAATAAACSGGEASKPTSPKTATTPATPEPEKTEEPAAAVSNTPDLRETIDPEIMATLKSAGLDISKLPPTLDDAIKTRASRDAVMKTFTIALGTKCEGCHELSGGRIDYELDTENKRIAKKMWANFVRGLQKQDGSAIYCDSCHQGQTKFLDRQDEEALKSWMRANFVNKLVRRDQQEHGCITCHGEPFNGDILDVWGK